jgi:antitoxin MazE
VAVIGRLRSLTQPKPEGRSADASQHFPQAIRRWGNSLAVSLPADCLSLEPLRRLDRSALATDLHQLQATMPLTPSVIEDCLAGERW